MNQTPNRKYFQLTNGQLEKVGNAMIYLSEKIQDISKTKLLKLLYLLDEFSIKKSGIPFLNLQYKVWRLGPVSESIFIELSDKPFRFNKFISVKTDNGKACIYPNTCFCDDEFSDNDMELLEYVSTTFKNTKTKELISYTHRLHSPWRNAAEANGIYDKLETGEITNTDIIINMIELVNHDERKKNIYEQYVLEN